MNTINGYRLTKTGPDTFTLRQPGTRNTLVVNRQQLQRMIKNYWGLRV